MLGHHCAESVLIASEVVERPPGASCFLIARGTVAMETQPSPPPIPDDQRTPSPLLAGQKAAGDAEGRAARERRAHTQTHTHTSLSLQECVNRQRSQPAMEMTPHGEDIHTPG